MENTITSTTGVPGQIEYSQVLHVPRFRIQKNAAGQWEMSDNWLNCVSVFDSWEAAIKAVNQMAALQVQPIYPVYPSTPLPPMYPWYTQPYCYTDGQAVS